MANRDDLKYSLLEEDELEGEVETPLAGDEEKEEEEEGEKKETSEEGPAM